MGKFWNRQLKQLFLYLILVMAAVWILCNLAFQAYRVRENQEIGELLAGIVGEVKESYPQVREEEIIRALNGQGHPESGRELLAHYGIFVGEGNRSFALWERRMGQLGFAWNLFFFLLMGGVLAGVFFYQRRRAAELTGLCRYMDRISHGEYMLEVENNGEDELTGLKNELYKITVQFRKQAELATRNKVALAEAVADISHQLKTPLTSAVVLADDLLEDRDMDPRIRQRFIREICRQLSGMKWLVTTMLKISRLDAGVVELEEKEIRVKALVEQVLEKVELPAEWKEIRLCTQIPEESMVTGDERWLAEALVNLVKNAVEHSPQGGTVDIIAEENEVYTQIQVRDQGGGMTREEQRHLFERYYQGSGAGPENVGIGLALAKEIVEKTGGSIGVESSEKGSIFTVKILKCH